MRVELKKWTLEDKFVALTSILAKVGIDGVNSNLATAIRTVVVVVMAWGMVFLTNAQNEVFGWMCFNRNRDPGDGSVK